MNNKTFLDDFIHHQLKFFKFTGHDEKTAMEKIEKTIKYVKTNNDSHCGKLIDEGYNYLINKDYKSFVNMNSWGNILKMVFLKYFPEKPYKEYKEIFNVLYKETGWD